MFAKPNICQDVVYLPYIKVPTIFTGFMVIPIRSFSQGINCAGLLVYLGGYRETRGCPGGAGGRGGVFGSGATEGHYSPAGLTGR